MGFFPVPRRMKIFSPSEDTIFHSRNTASRGATSRKRKKPLRPQERKGTRVRQSERKRRSQFERPKLKDQIILRVRRDTARGSEKKGSKTHTLSLSFSHSVPRCKIDKENKWNKIQGRTARAILVHCLSGPALTGLAFFFSVAEPKKEKTEQSANGAVSPSGEPQANQGTATTGSMPISAAPPNSGDQQKPSRPNTLEARVVTRRLILFDSEYSRSVDSLASSSRIFLCSI